MANHQLKTQKMLDDIYAAMDANDDVLTVSLLSSAIEDEEFVAGFIYPSYASTVGHIANGLNWSDDDDGFDPAGSMTVELAQRILEVAPKMDYTDQSIWMDLFDILPMDALSVEMTAFIKQAIRSFTELWLSNVVHTQWMEVDMLFRFQDVSDDIRLDGSHGSATVRSGWIQEHQAEYDLWMSQNHPELAGMPMAWVDTALGAPPLMEDWLAVFERN